MLFGWSTCFAVVIAISFNGLCNDVVSAQMAHRYCPQLVDDEDERRDGKGGKEA
jgi:hypothetical protein